MIQSGQIVIFRFPRTDLQESKMRHTHFVQKMFLEAGSKHKAKRRSPKPA
jgi:hypothetical protein